MMAAALLAGCAGAPRSPLVVDIPVALPCPAPELPTRPVLAVEHLPADASVPNVQRALVASLHALTGYARALEIGLSAYVAPVVSP